ncbi:hypothetical protein IT399_03270, partial [Candidatus Nomurabacteria bacterium]|nr:hypothetical protein [Candidatus Nomurabacteria bacterium]
MLSLFISKVSFAYFEQQGSKLVGTGTVGTVWQSTSVSISSDGNTAIVGGYGDDSNKGAAWIFTRTDGVWSQQGSKLVGTGAVGNAAQGYSVAISSDGNTAIVGGRVDDSNKGAAWIFTRTDGVWSQQGSKLVGTGAVGNADQGYSVAISSDGNTAVVGGKSDDSNKGAVWIFTRTDGVWSQQGSKLVGTGAVGNAAQGVSVSLSSDSNTAIVGGSVDDSNKGAAWIFTRTDGVWSQQGSKLVGTGAVGNTSQGISVSLSSDGNTAIVGGNIDASFKGAVWIFTRIDGVWSQQGNKLVGTGVVGTNIYQGTSVSISSDGNTAIVGGPGDDSNKGAAWIYTYVLSNNATVSSGEYTVSIIGGGSETITDVPFGTLKTDFLANLEENQVGQTWNDTDISDPVLTDDTLVVTAEDGTTVITYTVTVDPPSNDATIYSGEYTVSDLGGGAETITDVPFGTSKADFLANIEENETGQTWNDADISDPVLTDDTLVVTAEDGTTVITYTITVLPEPSHDATVISSVYTIGTDGGSSRTITNVPFATSQDDFLGNLTKGNIEQSWDSSDLNDPVITGDTLVVEAEDGTTTITYTITTLADSGVDIDTCAEFENIENALYRTYRLTTDLDCTSEGNNIMVADNGSPF